MPQDHICVVFVINLNDAVNVPRIPALPSQRSAESQKCEIIQFLKTVSNINLFSS